MPAVPFIAVALGASGAFAAVGATLASVIGISTISTAAATAIGAGAFSAAATAVQGGKASDVLKSAVLGGITSFAGSAIAGSIASSVSSAASGLDPGIATAMGKIAGSAVAGAISSGTSALLYGKDPIDALLKGGLTAAMSAGIGASVNELLKDVPAFSNPLNNQEAALQRATSAAIGTAIASGGNADAIGRSVLNSFAATAGNLIGQQIKDSSSQLSTANEQFRASEREYRDNLQQQQTLSDQYNSATEPLRNLYNVAEASKANYEKALNHYNQAGNWNSAWHYLTSLGGVPYGRGMAYVMMPDGNKIGTESYAASVVSNLNNAIGVYNNDVTAFNNRYTELLGGEVTKSRTETTMQGGYDENGYYFEYPVSNEVPYKEKVEGSLTPIQKQLDALKSQVDPLGQKLLEAKTNLEKAVVTFNETETENAARVKSQIDNFVTARNQYKEEFGVEPTEDQLKSFASSGDILGTVSKLVADNNNEQTAVAAGYKNYADYVAAGNITPNDYYAQREGWQDYAQKLNAQANGYSDPGKWNTHINNQQTAVDNGFANYQDYQAAAGTPSNDFYAKKEGWTNYAEKSQASDAGFRSPTAWNTYTTNLRNDEAARSAGFPDYATQQQYGGDRNAYVTAQNESAAKAAGFPDYATQQQYGGDRTAYITAQNNTAAQAAGFPDFETQTRFGNNVNEYKAVQEGWQSLSEKQAAAGYEITSPQKYQEFISGKTEEDKIVQMLRDRGIPATPERVADIMKAWDFNPTTPNVGFSDAFNQSDKLNISNSRADSVQEAAALAKSLGYSTFSFGGSDYKLNTTAPAQNPYDFFASFDEAFKAARKDLGDGQVFQWTNPETGKTGYFTTNLAGEKVTEGGFDASVTQSAKSRLLENIEDMKVNPADLSAKDMAKFVDQFANATPAQRAALLNGSYSSTFKVINDALTTQKTVLDNTAEAIRSGRLDLSKPIEGTGSIKPSDVTNYRQILSSMGTNIATDIASTALTGANIVGSALGLDTSDIEKTQKLLSTDKNKQMDKLVGLEKNAAAGFASAIESAFSFALGGAPAAIGVLTSFAANNAWLEGKEAGLSNQDNAIRTATMAAIEAAGEAIGIPGLSRLMKGVPMTGNPAEIVNAVKNFSLGMGNQQVSELVSTAASFAVDKFANFGLGKNATYQDFADALKDTVLTTAFAVGGTATIGQASRALQATSTEPTTQLWSQNLPDEIWNRIKDSGVSQSEVDALKSNLRSSFGSDNYTVQQIQENFETKLKEAGFTDQEISRIAEPAALDVIADQAKTSLEKAGVPKDYVDTLANLTATQIYNNEDLPSTFNNLSTAFQAYGFDPLQANLITNQTLTGTDVKQVVTDQLKAAGYNPTQAEIDNLISQNATAKAADIASSVSGYTGPRIVTKEEAKASLAAAGLSNPTDAQINALVGQYDQNLLQSRANTTAGDISTQLSSAEKASFDRDAALSKTLNDISAQVTANQNAGMNADQALNQAITQVATSVGTTKDQLLNQIGQTEQGLKDQIASLKQKSVQDIAGVKTQLGAVESALSEQIAANEASGMARDQAIEKAVTEVAQSVGQSNSALLTLIGQTQETLTQQYASGQLQLEGKLSTLDEASQQRYQALSEEQKLQAAQMAQQGKDLTQAISDVASASQQQITGVETKLSAAIEEAKQSGLQGDAALQSAITKVAGDLGTTKDALLSQMGATETSLRQEFAGQIGGVQAQIGNVQTALQSAIADARAAGLQGDQALQSAINTVAGNLGTTKDALLAQIGTTEAGLRQDFAAQIGGLQTQIGDVQSALQSAIANARAAGLQGDQALQSAINSVASNLGTTKEALLAQIGQTEAGLQQQIATGQTQTQAQIAQLDASTQEKFNQLTEAQRAQALQLADATKDLQGSIDTVAKQSQQQISNVQTSLQNQLTQQSEQTQKAFADMTAAQKEEVAARIQQGQDLQTAISGVQTSLGEQITGGLAALSQDFQGKLAASDAATQAAFANMDAAQKAEAQARVQQGQNLQTAIAGVQTGLGEQITAGQKKTEQEISNINKSLTDRITANEAAGLTRDEAISRSVQEIAVGVGSTKDILLEKIGQTETTLKRQYEAGQAAIRAEMEAQKAADEAAAKAAEEKAKEEAARSAARSRMSTGAGILGGMAGAAGLAALGGGATGAEEVSRPLQAKYLTSKGGDMKFKGLLEDFQREVEGAPNMPDNTANRQEGSDMSQYYSYGNETSLDQILGQNNTQDSYSPQFFAGGGLATPLMAAGGHTGTRYGKYAGGGMPSPLMAAGGKMRVDFRRGDAVTGPGDGQSDDIPAMLADGEFVFPADVVAAIGNGSTKAGSDALYDMMHNIRKRARSAHPKELPPEIKSPLDFLKKSRNKRRAK